MLSQKEMAQVGARTGASALGSAGKSGHSSVEDAQATMELYKWQDEAGDPRIWPPCPTFILILCISDCTSQLLQRQLGVLVKGVNMMLRKIAVAAASKPAVEIKQEGDTFYIKTSTTVRTTEINFKVGEEFEEQTVDGRPCKSLVKWESENKMVCEQRLLKGEGPKTSWTRELTNDGELILTMTADDVVCTRVYIRE
ncbi:Cellular retinoic acid-binding protein 2 [Heterocephalus glaber]|uniref:Cellular retinoic acid-binding protein 2 n=1 Tax=Heterocephalus glaber TaxID=10181 RepID=G5AR81_HETGA|nr:Cellular retinoic acid-binding protein 2 [Heterocephalus glaber]